MSVWINELQCQPMLFRTKSAKLLPVICHNCLRFRSSRLQNDSHWSCCWVRMCACVRACKQSIRHCRLWVLILRCDFSHGARSQIFVLRGCCCFMCEQNIWAFVSLSHRFLLLLGEQRADTLKENKWICFVSHFQVAVCLPVLHNASLNVVLEMLKAQTCSHYHEVCVCVFFFF